MIIGIDLDNTIANLDPLFGIVGTKIELGNFEGIGKQGVKSALTKADGSDMLWQKLQGRVYGAEYHQAQVYAGAREVIRNWCEDANIEVFIVSHKTQYGHQDDDKVDLHHVAMSWLMEKGITGEQAVCPSHVYFELTQEQKLARISALSCDIFIDDLVAIVEHALFPHTAEGLLFSPHERRREITRPERVMHSWSEIAAYIELKLSAYQHDEEL
jgi:hypothetical protein